MKAAIGGVLGQGQGSMPAVLTSSTLNSCGLVNGLGLGLGGGLGGAGGPFPLGYVGSYSPEARRERIARFVSKRDKRVWTKKVKYDVRKNFADSRLRVKVRVRVRVRE
jgi:hypothetical protein